MEAKLHNRLGQLSDMDLRLLHVFKTVVDCGGITAAEPELNVGISTLSRQIKDLELRLGLVLCRRGRAGFAVTAEGQRVYDETAHLLTAMEGFRQRVSDLRATMGGRLHVALFEKTVSNPQSRISVAINRFVAQAPSVALNLHIGGIAEVEHGVIDGAYQIGVIAAMSAPVSDVRILADQPTPSHAPRAEGARRSHANLRQTFLFGERMQLYCAADHELAPPARQKRLNWKTLRAWPLAGLGYHSPNMQISHQRGLSRSATSSDQEGVATLLLSGRFIGFLPEHYAEPFVRQGRLCVIQQARFFYDCNYFCVVRRAPQLSRAAKVFHDCLVEAHRL